MWLDADPDLFSFEHHLLAVEAVLASGRERNGKRLGTDVAAVALERADDHPIGVVSRVDAILDVQPDLFPTVLDGTHQLACQTLELQLFRDHGVQTGLCRAEREA